MNTKHYLIISGIVGGIIGSLLTALVVSPVTAQKDKFGEIECTKLTVVDADGKERVILSTNSFDILSVSNGVSIVGSASFGGYIGVCGKNRKRMVELSIGDRGGRVGVLGKEGRSEAWLGIGEHGGRFNAYGKDGDMKASLSINELGGDVVVSGEDSSAWLGIGEHGGRVVILAERSWLSPRASLGINEHGNGYVVTWDKNGDVQ